MSLLELIAKRNSGDLRAFSLPDFMAEQALVTLPPSGVDRGNAQIAHRFAVTLLSDDRTLAGAFAEALLARGVSERRFLLGYVAGAADVLGAGWGEDKLTFSQVTDAMGRLTEVARDMMSNPPVEANLRPNRPRILLIRPPGEDHTLGLLLAAQTLRKRGWLVKVDLTGTMPTVCDSLSAQAYDLIGFSIGCEQALPVMTECMRQTRTRCRDAGVIVSGWLARDPDSLKRETGADMVLSRENDMETAISMHFQLEDA